MDNGSSENKTYWMPICRDIGFAVLACVIWTSTFSLIFAGY